MGNGVSKLENSPLVSMCKERKEFIKVTKCCWYDLVLAFVMYLHSLIDVGNALNHYVEEELVILDDSPQVSRSDYESSEEDAHVEFPSSDSESDLDSFADHVHSDMEVPRRPSTENQDQSAANLSTKCIETRQNEMPRVIPGQLWNIPSGHPHHNYQEDTRTHVDALHEDLVYHKYNQKFSFSNRWENPQSRHSYPQHVNRNLPGSSMGFCYYDDRFLHHPAEAISMAIPSSYPKSQKHVTEQNPPTTNLPFSHLFSLNDDYHYENLHFSYSYDPRSIISDCDVREVREREGIPDLEDETEQDSIDTKFDKKGIKRLNLSSGDCTSNAAQLNSHKDVLSGEEKAPRGRGNITKIEINADTEVFESKNLKPEIREVESSDAEETIVLGSKSLGTSCVSSPVASCRVGLKEAIQDIKDEFENFFDFGKEFSATIEVGRLPHQSLSTRLKGFASFVLGLIVPSVVTSTRPPPHILLNQLTCKGQLLFNANKTNNQGHVCAEFGDLSSTLEGLYVWEKRLYGEVMGEEKLQILYEKKCKRLKDLDDRGEESDKISNIWASVRRMQSEINVAVASISVISTEIDKLRDHKLLPELYKLIERLIRLWKFMGTCHLKQFQTISEAKSHIHILDPSRNRSSSQATLRLERTILKWGRCFSNFVNTQKDFVKYLNEWLLRCMFQEPEETSDRTAPFSPSRIGAPPVFNLCNAWYHAIDSISENGVSKAFSNFASNLHHLYVKQKEEQAQKARVDYLLRDYEDRLKSFLKKNRTSFHHNFSSDTAATTGVIKAEVPLLDGFDETLTTSRKRLVEQRARHQEVIRQVNDTASCCLQAGLSPIFEVLESYCLENLKAYELLRLPDAAPHD